MKIRFANNIEGITGDSDISLGEVSDTKDIERVAKLSKDAIEIATDIFKTHPEFKQVTLDTMTDEERVLIELSKTKAELS